MEWRRAIGGQSHATLSDSSLSAGHSACKNDVGRFRNLFSEYTPVSGLVPPHTNAFPSANRNTALVSKSNADTWGFGRIETGDGVGVFCFKSASSLPSPPATHLRKISNEVECLHDIASSTGAFNCIASSTFSSHGIASSAGVIGANKSDRVQPWQMRNRHSTHSQEQSLRISQSPVHGFDYNSSGNTSGVVTQHFMKQKETVLWLRYWDGEERKHYYYNTATEETAWVLPDGAIFEDGDEESKREALAASSNPPLPSSAPSDSLRKVVIPPFIPKLWHEGATFAPFSTTVSLILLLSPLFSLSLSAFLTVEVLCHTHPDIYTSNILQDTLHVQPIVVSTSMVRYTTKWLKVAMTPRSTRPPTKIHRLT